MRPIRVSVAAQAASAVVPLDSYNASFNVGIGVVLSAGSTLTFTVQYTYDDANATGFDPATATWFSLTALAGKTANTDAPLTTPVTAVRLSVTAYTSGRATMTVIQAGMPGN